MTSIPPSEPPDAPEPPAPAAAQPPEPGATTPPIEPGPVAPATAPPMRRGIAGEVIAWLIILGITALVPVMQWLDKQEKAQTAATQPVYEKPDVAFLVMCRYFVGSKATLKQFGQANATQDAAVMRKIEELADTPAERLRVAVVAAELGDAQDAVTRIDAVLREDLDERNREDAEWLRRQYVGSAAEDGEIAIEAPDATQPDDAAIQQRLDWFGQLAASYGRPDTDPIRADAMSRAIRSFLGGIAFGLGLAVVGLVSLLLLVIAIVLVSTRKLGRAYRPAAPRAAPKGVFVEGFAVYLIAQIALGVAAVRLMPVVGLGAFLLGFFVVPAVLAWLAIRGVRRDELRAALGWHKGRGWWWEVGAGVGGYLAGIPLMFLAAIITAGLSNLAGSRPEHPIIDWVQSPSPWVPLQLYVIACVLAPVVEELMFRGVFYHYLRIRLPYFASAVLVAAVFAMLHPQGWLGLPMLMTLAVVFASLREWRGSIIAPMVAHAVNNGVATTLLLVMTR